MSETSIMIAGVGMTLTPRQADDIVNGVCNGLTERWDKEKNRYVFKTRFFSIYLYNKDVSTIQLSTENNEYGIKKVGRTSYFGYTKDAIIMAIQHPFYQTILIHVDGVKA